jgi:hypothetical protein
VLWAKTLLANNQLGSTTAAEIISNFLSNNETLKTSPDKWKELSLFLLQNAPSVASSFISAISTADMRNSNEGKWMEVVEFAVKNGMANPVAANILSDEEFRKTRPENWSQLLRYAAKDEGAKKYIEDNILTDQKQRKEFADLFPDEK